MSQVDETRKLTASRMGWHEADLDWINDEYLAPEARNVEIGAPVGAMEGQKTLPDRFFAHNVSYGRDDSGRFFYRFQSGNTGCDLGWFTAWQDEYDHYNQDAYCGGVVHPSKQSVLFVRK